MAYTKLFSSIITSTIWSEDDRTRIVWITMLALADKNGEVQGSIPGLARLADVPVEDCEKAVAKFLSPDPYSRTKDDEGRRIEEIDGGWHLLNHGKYRDMASRDEQKEADRIRKARYRDRLKRNGKQPDMSQNVRDMSHDVPETLHIAEADSEADSESDINLIHTSTKKQTKTNRKGTESDLMTYATEIGLPASDGATCYAKWEGNGWTNGGKAIKCWKATMRSWKLQHYMPSQKGQTTTTKPNNRL
jgi:hypothetical protein